MYDSPKNFGKDLGLMHEIVVQGRNTGLGHEWWKLLLNRNLLEDVAEFVASRPILTGPILQGSSCKELVKKSISAT